MSPAELAESLRAMHRAARAHYSPWTTTTGRTLEMAAKRGADLLWLPRFGA